MPSEISPPRIGTLIMKDLFRCCRSKSPLTKNTKRNDPKKAHSFLDREENIRFNSDFFGNKKLRIGFNSFCIIYEAKLKEAIRLSLNF